MQTSLRNYFLLAFIQQDRKKQKYKTEQENHLLFPLILPSEHALSVQQKILQVLF